MHTNLKLRLGLFLTVFGLLIGAYVYRLIQLQVVTEQKTSSATGTYTYDTRVIAARGEILDRNGNVLVSNRASYNLILSGYALFNSPSPNESLRQLVQLGRELNIEFVDHFPVTRVKPYEYETADYSDTWNNHFREFLRQHKWDSDVSAAQLVKLMRSQFHIPNDWPDEDVRGVLGLRYELDLRNYRSLSTYTLLSDVDAIQLAALMELNTPGMQVQASTVREYNTTYAAHILGRIAAMSPEEWEVYKTKDYAMDAFVGKDGLEKAFEEQLHGTDGVLRTTVDRSGNIIAQYYAVEPKAGSNVETTIDLNYQTVAEETLKRYILNLRENGVGSKLEGKDAEGGAVVMLDVKTGAVLASASYPTFNLATFSKDYNELIQEEYSPLLNRALMQAYPPGSTYKMSTAIAALNSGIISQYTTVEDKGIYDYYDDYQPACYYYTSTGMTHGVIDCAQALMVSCNCFFYEVGRRIGWRRMDETAKALGLGEATGVELAETTGWRANPDTKKTLYKNPGDQVFTAGDTISMAIGQSDNRFSPMQLAVYTAALANRGVRYKATFLNRIISADYQKLLYESEPTVASRLSVTDEAYQVYTSGMRMAVSSGNGTAHSALGDYPVAVCAKTGTAQHGSPGSDHASFVCYAPANDPQVAIAIYVEKGAQGGSLGNIARALLDVYFATTTQNDTIKPENAPD